MDSNTANCTPTFFTFSVPKSEPPNKDTAWIKLGNQYNFPAPLKFDIHQYLQQLKSAAAISQYAVVELVVKNQ